MTVYDVAVVGLGAVGSAAAFHLAKSGRRVIGFDRFRPPHVLGSTHGGSRIIRRAYFEGGVFLPLLERAYSCWRELEAVAGTPILQYTGALTIGRRDGPIFEGAAGTARTFGVAHEVFDPPETMRRFPAFRLRPEEAALFEPAAGWIHPEEAVRAYLEAADRHGCVVRTGDAVTDWRATSDGFEITAASGHYAVDRLAVCSGGWIASMLEDLGLPLTLERQVNAWYRPSAAADLAPDRCPVYVWADEADRILYGFPDLGEGVKAGLHHAGTALRHPDELDRTVREDDVRQLTERLRRLLPGACGAVVHAATCFYTNTPEERFIIDVHPRHAGLAFASACSGHGFKFSSAVGEQVALLALGADPTVDLAPYRLSRYTDGGGPAGPVPR